METNHAWKSRLRIENPFCRSLAISWWSPREFYLVSGKLYRLYSHSSPCSPAGNVTWKILSEPENCTKAGYFSLCFFFFVKIKMEHWTVVKLIFLRLVIEWNRWLIGFAGFPATSAAHVFPLGANLVSAASSSRSNCAATLRKKKNSPPRSLPRFREILPFHLNFTITREPVFQFAFHRELAETFSRLTTFLKLK